MNDASPAWKEFRIVRRLGRGGSGDVWLAERISDGAPAVIKAVDASTAGLLEHFDLPGLPRLLCRDASGGRAALSYLPGVTLREELRAAGPLPAPAALSAAAGAARVLAGVWCDYGWLHRDLKPEHIIRSPEGAIGLIDWHLAAAPDPNLDTRCRIGTPAYLSPEACAGAPLDDTSDQYSLGITLFELLTGRRPFRQRSMAGLAAAHLAEPLPATPELAGAVRELLERMTAKFPDERFPGWIEVIDAIDDLG